MTELALWFTYSGSTVELAKTSFRYEGKESAIIAVRGKTSGVEGNAGTFQWSPAVRALCVLLMRAVSKHLTGNVDIASVIKGDKGSLAASLDYALDKEPQWLVDMFGLDQQGRSLLRRLLLRSNPGRKRLGPVSIGINPNALDSSNIVIYVDERPIHDPAFIDHMVALLVDEAENGKDTAELMMMHLINDRRTGYYKAKSFFRKLRTKNP